MSGSGWGHIRSDIWVPIKQALTVHIRIYDGRVWPIPQQSAPDWEQITPAPRVKRGPQLVNKTLIWSGKPLISPYETHWNYNLLQWTKGNKTKWKLSNKPYTCCKLEYFKHVWIEYFLEIVPRCCYLEFFRCQILFQISAHVVKLDIKIIKLSPKYVKLNSWELCFNDEFISVFISSCYWD